MTTSRPIAEIAFPKWLELTGVDPRHFKPGGKKKKSRTPQDDDTDEGEDVPASYTFGSYEATSIAVEIHNCLFLPDQELTAQLMLATHLAQYTKQTKFTLDAMLNAPDKIQQNLVLCKQIKAVLESDQALMLRLNFTESMERAVAHYGAQKREDVQELIEDDAGVAVLRRDALTALDRMRQSQFLSGEAGPLVRPQYSTVIRRWWNMDHLLAAHTSIPEGVSLNLIKTPAEHDMFFCFVVRRGANLYVLDDAAEYSHPLEGSMSRRKGKRMAERMAKFWFPYDLADVEIDEKGRARVGKHQPGSGIEIVGKINEFSQIVGTIAELSAEELLWSVMVFDLIMDRFWSKEPLPSLPLSYTANQLKPENLLLQEASKAAGLPVVAQPLGHMVVPSLNVEQVANLHAHPDAQAVLGEMGSYGSISWLEKRYAHMIPDEALNQISADNQMARLGLDGKLTVLENPNMEKIEREEFFKRDEVRPLVIQGMNPTTFGTPETLRADRAFLSRYNYAQAIGRFAEKEFSKQSHKLREWLDAAYAERVPFLLTLAPAAHADKLVVVDWEPEQAPTDMFEFHGGYNVSFDRTDVFAGHKDRKRGCQHTLGWTCTIEDNDTGFMPYLPQGGEGRPWKAICQATGAKASYLVAFKPTNAVELAWLLGKRVDELPELLQELSALGPESGNPILNRIDPMLWAVKNPWEKFKLGAKMGLSKRGLAQLQKQHPDAVDLSHLNGVNLAMFQGQKAAPSRKPRPG